MRERGAGSRRRVDRARGRPQGPSRGPRTPFGSDERSTDWIFGIHPVREALESGRPLAVVQRAREVGDGRVHEVVRLAEARGVAVVRVPRVQLDRLAGIHTHQGIAAQTSPVVVSTLAETLAETSRETDRFWVVLDGVTDDGNAGSLVRSAVALGATAVLVPATGGVRPHAGLARCSSGAASRIRWVRLTHPASELAELRASGFRLYGAVVTNGRAAVDTDRHGDRVLLLGSEERGLRPAVEELLDARLTIPTTIAMPSLNVAAAGAILLAALGNVAPRPARESRCGPDT
ncbi:MAG: RNA methyltransferase [bacterium]